MNGLSIGVSRKTIYKLTLSNVNLFVLQHLFPFSKCNYNGWKDANTYPIVVIAWDRFISKISLPD